MAVYLIHFDRPYRHARHYLGFVEGEDMNSLSTRFDYHMSGRGSRLMKAAAEAGIRTWVVCRWPGLQRGDERVMKLRGSLKRLCPVCRTSRGHELMADGFPGRHWAMD